MNISKKEYEELQRYKKAFTELMQLKKREGASYDRLQSYKDMDAFFKKRYKATYQAMVKEYKEHVLYSALDKR